MTNINQKISQLSGLITAFGTELKLENLEIGTEYLLIQELELALTPLLKRKEELKKLFLEQATETPQQIEGAEIYKKIIYPKPTLDSSKLESDLIRLYSEIGSDYNQSLYLKQSTPRVTLVIQSILNK